MGQQPDEAEARQLLEFMARGGIPEAAQERLNRQRAGGAWTSDLSVPEFAAIRSAGFIPTGQVMGSSVYKLGWMGYVNCYGYYGFTVTDLAYYSDALAHVRRLALGRMSSEAGVLGGHGVVGVRLNFREFEEAAGMVEFTAIGTAITRQGRPPLDSPFLSALSGQDFAKLLRVGMVPCGFVMGISAVHVHTGWMASIQQNSWANNEVTDFSQAVAHARHLAMTRLAQDAAALGADGTVGSEITVQVWRTPCQSNKDQEDHIVQFTAIGTAVARYEGLPAEEQPRLVMPLADRRTTGS